MLHGKVQQSSLDPTWSPACALHHDFSPMLEPDLACCEAGQPNHFCPAPAPCFPAEVP